MSIFIMKIEVVCTEKYPSVYFFPTPICIILTCTDCMYFTITFIAYPSYPLLSPFADVTKPHSHIFECNMNLLETNILPNSTKATKKCSGGTMRRNGPGSVHYQQILRYQRVNRSIGQLEQLKHTQVQQHQFKENVK